MKTTFHQRIGTVKFSSLFKESPCSPVVTFPSFGSEGHGVHPRRGTPVLLVVPIYFPFCFVVVVVFFFFMFVLVSTGRAAPSFRRKIKIMAFF